MGLAVSQAEVRFWQGGRERPYIVALDLFQQGTK